MSDEDLMRDLPPMMAAALRLRAAGETDGVIATAAGIPVQGVASLIEIAEAKLAHLREQRP